MRSMPPWTRLTSTWRAPASRAFSTSSFTTDAGRSITSPAAICPCTLGGSIATFPTRLAPGSENEAGILPRDPRLDLGTARFESGATEQAEGDLLGLLDRRLGERLDSRQPARAPRRQLGEVDRLAQRERIDGGQDEGRARAAAARQRQLGRVLGAVQQPAQRVAAEAPDLLDVLEGRRDVERLA